MIAISEVPTSERLSWNKLTERRSPLQSVLESIKFDDTTKLT